MPELYEEVKKHFNEPVIIGFNLCRIIGYAEDDEDCYLIYKHPIKGSRWCTLVGGYTYLDSLKDQGVTIPSYPSFPGERWTDFSRLDGMLELNGAPKEKNFIVVMKTVEREDGINTRTKGRSIN